ncbi:hypothetical protein HZS_3664 [Henneguya salminicola]|nr:hypothetical protein HZS_3664 [Henneguya salminicola]
MRGLATLPGTINGSGILLLKLMKKCTINESTTIPSDSWRSYFPIRGIEKSHMAITHNIKFLHP